MAKAPTALMGGHVAHRALVDTDAAPVMGPCQILGLHVCRHVHGGQLRWQPHGVSNCPHSYSCCASYGLWQKLFKVFWWLVLIMLVLTAVCSFQFQDCPLCWHTLMRFAGKQMGKWPGAVQRVQASSRASSSWLLLAHPHPAAALLPPALLAAHRPDARFPHLPLPSATSPTGLTGGTAVRPHCSSSRRRPPEMTG